VYRPHRGAEPEAIGFLLLPRYSAMAFFSAIEPLRVANRLAGRPLFTWHVLSADGEAVEASSGMRLVVDGPIEQASGLPTLIVCSSFEPERVATRRVLGALRGLARAGVTLGALDTGATVLALAGLCRDVTVTMHWEAVPAFREQFPDIRVSDELFEVQGSIFTCAGGTAALDLMLDMIGRKHGADLAIAVSEQLIHDRIRSAHDHQRMTLANRLSTTNSKVLAIVGQMEANLEQPVKPPLLAQRAGITARQMERLFRAQLGASPAEFYRGLRLERARQLLRQTDMRLVEVAMATGFSSASSLSRCYARDYGLPPSEDRRDPQLAPKRAAPIPESETAR
jgi:AraC family carnitine catabolism transcriptional activator